MRKALRALCVLLLLMLPVWAAAESRVFDEADLFSSVEIREMENKIAWIQQAYQVDVVVLTSYDAPYNRSLDYADLYYENGGFGMGEDDAGLLYFIDMNSRVPTISTTGVMIDYITESRLEDLLDAGYDELSDGEYGAAALAVLDRLEDFMHDGREEGSFRYDAQTGQRLSGLYNRLTLAEFAIAALIACAAAMLFVVTVQARYSLKGGAYRYDVEGNASRELIRDEETFLRQHVTRTVHHQNPPGGHGGSSGGRGSAVHRSSSGRTHGGGSGRRF